MAKLEITPEDFVAAVERGVPYQVLDVRAEQRLASGTLDIVPDDRFFNFRGSVLMGLDDLGSTGIDTAAPLAVVCGFGNDSRRIARRMQADGFQALSVAGGIARWSETVIPRTVEPPAGADQMIQFDRIGKGALGYAIVSRGEALIVDPPRRPASYLEAIARVGARIVGVADTHAHADYISGSPALAKAVGAPYYLHPADAVYPYDGTPGKLRIEALEDRAEIRFGDVAVTTEHLPGHTEGSIVYRFGEDCALTGDLLFLASVGRPDLGERTEEWTSVLWNSLERIRAEWPADLRVFPAHYSSESERAADRSVWARFGDLPAGNEPFAIRDEAEFRRWVLDRAGSFPQQYKRIKAINIGIEQVTDEEALELEAGRNQCALG